ncbi:glycoside hydrolase family 26 protein [Actinoplanes sp. G11-F43]|uniref:glycoside hydrolase family 26 protein n=1 Tax=Actinoplanes sp. G11-F43 TaxID=3424130 RepID=UPI003D325A1F
MSDVSDPPRRGRLWLAVGGIVVLALGIAIAITVNPADDHPVATPRASTIPTSPKNTPGVTADPRSARQMIALPREAGAWPGPNGMSGVNGFPVLDSASVTGFCTSRGRPCNVAQTYTDRTDYDSMTRGSGWTFENFADFDGVLVISQALVPDKGEGLMAACANGDYDQHWRDFGTLMVQHGRGDSIVRLGWEMNEGSMAWRGLNTERYIACYRTAATALRETNPQVVLDWTINAHNTPEDLCGGLSTNCYPGDEYTDIIGIDNYDHHPWSPTKADFDRTAAAPEGLTWFFDFARSRGKLFSVGEWGIMPTGDAGRDNPEFIGWMHEWFAAHAPYLAYEAYFQRCDGTFSQSSILRPDDPDCLPNTGSSDAYVSLFKR